MCVCQFSGKTNSFDFFSPNLPKNEFKVGKSKKYCCNKNSILDIPCVPIFSQNELLRIFPSKFLQKKDLGLETEKSNVRTKIKIVETLCVPIFSQTGQL